MIRIIKTLGVIIGICCVWLFLESAMYGEISPRIADDVILLIMIPIIYKATRESDSQ